MSLLLSLFSLKTLNASRNGRNHELQHCTEMGVFSRGCEGGTELVEISSGAVARLATERHDPDGQDDLSQLKEIPRDVLRWHSAVSQPDLPPAEASFVWEVLNQGLSTGDNEFTQDALERLCWSGSVLCKLLSSALPGSLDERAINWCDGVFDLTREGALENFQMCHSCAQAEGCDVQGIDVDRLAACEVSCLTDFCLEVLRLSAVQVLPASDRQFLVAPSPKAALLRGATGGNAASSFSHTRDGRSGIGHGRLRIDVTSSTSGNASHVATAGDQAVSGQPGTCMRGTAAARRAMAGLERWAVQLAAETAVDPDQFPSSEASSGPPTPLPATVGSPGQTAAPGFQLHLSPARHAGTTPRGVAAGVPHFDLGPLGQSRSNPSFEDGDVRSSHLTSVGFGIAAPGAAATTAKATESAASLGRARGCRGDVHEGSRGSSASPSEVGAATDPLGLAVWEYLAQLLTESTKVSSSKDEATSAAPAAAGELRVSDNCDAVPPVTGGPSSTPDDEDARWVAAADALSKVLTALRVGRPQLPRLRAEHLQCRHPGLRSLLLAWALLAHCRQRDGLQPKASMAAAMPSSPSTEAVDTVRSDDDSGTSSCSGNRPYSGGGSPDRVKGTAKAENTNQGDGGCAAAAAVAVAAAATKMLPASPAPPLPPLRQSLSVGGSAARRHRSAGDRAPKDVLSEHNMLVQQEHQQREMRRQLQEQQQHRSAGGERPCAGDAVARPAPVMLWTGDDDDAEGEDQEERVLRLWLNSLDPGIHVSSLFEQEVTTGWPLLQALDAIQTGCVPWADAFRPPFKDKLRKILSVQNCNLVIEVCTRQLAMPPLVNIGGLDLALGHRRATLSLVFQMMRHHMGMLLGLAAPHALPAPPPSPKYNIPASPGLHQQQQPLGHSHSFVHTPWHGQDASPHLAQHGPPAPSPQRGTRAHLEVEKAVLAWANAKLVDAAVAAAAAAAAPHAGGSDAAASPSTSEPAACRADLGLVAPQLPWTPLASFADKRLGEGRVLLQLLAAICPRSVNPKYVLPGRNAEERGSNARYLLSCARKLGCVIFLGWEDVVAARPNLLLLLLASFMALDRKRGGAAAACAAAGAAAPAGTAAERSPGPRVSPVQAIAAAAH